MRRPLAALLLCLAPTVHSPAAARADDLATLPASPAPGRMLYDALQARAKEHFDARRKAVAALKTPADVARRQAELRAAFRAALGELPADRGPLNARVVATGRREGCRVEKVVYESRPGHVVTALLYLPDAPPPYPGVLVPCGHSANGKAAETYQRVSILLARSGMAALCYDPIGQGERVQAFNDAGKPLFAGSTAEHTATGIGAWLVGRSVAGYRVWDGVRSLDYLASRPDVDPDRLGCTGNSGGGTETAYLMAFDDRIKVAAPSCYITSLERLFATIGPQDAEQNITGQVALGIEHADYVTMRAPKPTLLSVGTQDFFDIDGSWTTFREVKEVYCTLGLGERVDLFESNEPHGFTKPRRESCTRWMRRWLLGKDDAVAEPDFAIASDGEAQVKNSGQVLQVSPGVRESSSVSVFELNASRADELARQRASKFARRSPDALRAEVRKQLALPEASKEIIVHQGGRVERDGYDVTRWAFETEPGVLVPVLMFRAREPKPGPITVYINADRAIAAPGGEVEKRVKAGESVALVEPRGLGETTPGGSKLSRKGPFGADESEAFLSIHLGRPLLGQRVYDVLQALRGLRPTEGENPGYHLIGIGPGALVAFHVAALDDRVKSVTLRGGLVSWTALAKAAASRNQLAAVVPGVLASYDLPDLAAAVAPRALTIESPRDPMGESVAADEAAAAYATARAVYEAKKAADRFSIR